MTKAELHELVDALPEVWLDAAAVLLRRARDPVIAKLDAAPFDDEPVTDADRDAIRDAVREPGLAWSEVLRELRMSRGGSRSVRCVRAAEQFRDHLSGFLPARGGDALKPFRVFALRSTSVESQTVAWCKPDRCSDAAAEYLRYIEHERGRKPSTLCGYRSARSLDPAHVATGFSSDRGLQP